MQSLGLLQRILFAYVAFFRILIDGRFAAQVLALGRGQGGAAAAEGESFAPELPAAPARELLAAPREPARPTERDLSPALELLALLQERGRLIDFLQEDVTAASDADLGAAARVVHDGCRKVLGERMTIEPLRAEAEGSAIGVPAGFSPAEIKLSGALRGEAPFQGVLRHRGWRASSVSLPVPTAAHRAEVLAAAEVEL